MNAAVVQRTGLDVPGRPSKFFQALDEADQHLRDVEWLEREGLFAPPVTTYGKCICGGTFEARSSQVAATEQEKSAAADAIAEIYGHRGSDSPVYAQLVARVIDAINHERASAAGDALRDWEDAHAYCDEGDWS